MSGKRVDVLQDAIPTLSYGPSITDHWRRSATCIDRILEGTTPRRPSVERLTRFLLVVNRRTARALGTNLPASILARADEIIGE